MNFASSAARSSAIPTPTKGMLALTTDNNEIDYYDGSDWVSALPILWSSYTPTFTNFTLGNGTINFTYVQIGKTVHVRGLITLGSTSSVTGSIIFSLPVSQATTLSAPALGNTRMAESGASAWAGIVLAQSPTTVNCVTTNVAGTYPLITSTGSTVPFTWGTADTLTANITYQAA